MKNNKLINAIEFNSKNLKFWISYFSSKFKNLKKYSIFFSFKNNRSLENIILLFKFNQNIQQFQIKI